MIITTLFFFFNDTATTEIYTLSLHDALPICRHVACRHVAGCIDHGLVLGRQGRSEEHTSELQSRPHLVCRLLLEKKKIKMYEILVTSVLSKYQTVRTSPISIDSKNSNVKLTI